MLIEIINSLQTGAGLLRQMVTPSSELNSRNNLTGKGTIVAIVDSGERVIIMSS